MTFSPKPWLAALLLAVAGSALAASPKEPPQPAIPPAPVAPPDLMTNEKAREEWAKAMRDWGRDQQQWAKEWSEKSTHDWSESWAPTDGENAIDERRPVKPGASVRVSNPSGSIEIATWDRNEVYVTGELGHGVDRLDVSGSDSKLEIAVRNPQKSRNVQGSELRILLPASVDLTIDAVSADVTVQGIRGKLTAATVSGEMTLSLASPQVEARSVSGDLVLSSPSQETRLNTVSGDVRVSGPSGRLYLETVSGDAELVGAGAFTELKLKSISGDFRIDATLAPQARLSGETLSGDLQLRLPANTAATARLHSFSGELKSGFGAAATGALSGERSDSRELKLGGGGAEIDLSSFSGDIRLDRR